MNKNGKRAFAYGFSKGWPLGALFGLIIVVVFIAFLVSKMRLDIKNVKKRIEKLELNSQALEVNDSKSNKILPSSDGMSFDM